MPTTLKFPNDILLFLYLVFFKPITLNRYIKLQDSSLAIDSSLITLWRHGRTKPALRALISFSLFHILITPWAVGFGTAAIIGLLGVALNWWDGVVIGAVIGAVIDAVFGVLFGVLFGVVFGVVGIGVFSVVFSVVFGVVFVVVIGVVGVESIVGLFAVAFSAVIFGVVMAVVIGVVIGGSVRVAVGVAVGVVVGMVIGVAVGVSGGMAVGVAVGAGWIISYFRLFLYIIQVPISLLQERLANSENATAFFRYSPVQWDELIWLPLFGLDQHLIIIGKHNRQDAQQPIALVAQSFRQQWAATNALIELTAYDVERTQGVQGIASIAEQFTWLPPTMPKDLENVLPPIREIAEYARGAVESDTLWNKQTQLRNAKAQTTRVREGLALSSNRKIAARFGQALQTWEQVFDKELASLQTLEAIPNVYVAGSPLASTSKVFKGRRDLFVALERELATAAEQRPTLLLFGARRSGKTSVIKQMPNRLGPNVVPVEIDLQSATAAEDASGLLAYIADQVKTNALNYRRIQLPALPREELRGDPYMTFLTWLARVEEIVGDKWILLNLDEYEHITQAMEQHRLDERVFQFLRGIIQHHPRVTILLSGSHTLEDLPSIWSNYLINVRVLRIGALKEDEARELIVRPIDEFPLQYEPAAVDRIIQVTGCQPYLVQATCRDLVNALNEANRMTATLADVDAALDQVLTSSVAYFQDLWGGRDSDDTQRAIMRAVARNENPKGLQDPSGFDHAIRKLANRDVLHVTLALHASAGVTQQYRFRVELVRRWVERNAS